MRNNLKVATAQLTYRVVFSGCAGPGYDYTGRSALPTYINSCQTEINVH